ncbi:MAG: phosphate signaling complex protein PhoU [Planctomycetota bacterium]|nr:phosphate signaling complex protein PhoU [Planctomycetota bacterium]
MTETKWIDEVKTSLTEMSDRVQNTVDESLRALFDGDTSAVEKVFEAEEELDQLEVEIEERAITIFEEENPRGYDLRFLISSLKINNDLERMGDHAVDIAEAAKQLGKIDREEFPALMPLMVDRAKDLHKKSLACMNTEDIGKALQVRGEDVVIDRYAKEITEELAERGMAAPASVPRFLQMLTVVRSVERIADLATNIAENVIYLVEGTIVRHSSLWA